MLAALGPAASLTRDLSLYLCSLGMLRPGSWAPARLGHPKVPMGYPGARPATTRGSLVIWTAGSGSGMAYRCPARALSACSACCVGPQVHGFLTLPLHVPALQDETAALYSHSQTEKVSALMYVGWSTCSLGTRHQEAMGPAGSQTSPAVSTWHRAAGTWRWSKHDVGPRTLLHQLLWGEEGRGQGQAVGCRAAGLQGMASRRCP